MNPRVLLTGITGCVGSHLADFLLENTNWDIYGMCRWRSPLDNVEHLLKRANNKDRVFFLNGDLCDYISLQQVIEQSKPDYVFHLAAQSYPLTSFTSPLQTLDTNILGTERLLEVIRKQKDIDPIIHVCASSEVFGRVPKEKLPIDEECSFHPASPYAISKIGTDLIGRFHAEAYGQKIITTRMFTHSVSRWTPVIVRDSKSGLIDIKYISEIRQAHKKGGYFSGNVLEDETQIWDMSRSDLEVWNKDCWTKVKHISCHPIRKAKMLHVVTREGVVNVTDGHSMINKDQAVISAKKLKKGDAILTTDMPQVEITEVPEDLAWMYGFFVAEGSVPLDGLGRISKRIKISNTKRDLLEKCQKALLKYLGADSKISEYDDMFYLSVRKPEIFMKYFDDIYAKDRNKRIPKIILNADKKTKLAFLRGFNLGDGYNGGIRNDINAREYVASEFYSFKTKSPLVATGLCFLIKTVLNVDFRIGVEHRNETQYYEIRCHKQTESKRGNQFIKAGDEIIDIRTMPYEGEVWDFETENHWFHAGIGNIVVHNTGPRRGDVFAESTFAKQIAMIEIGLIPPIVKTGNLNSMRTWADVRDAVRAYYMLATVNPIPGEYYNIGGSYSCSIHDMLKYLISLSSVDIKFETESERLRPIDADLQIPNTSKFRNHTGWKPEIPFEKTMKDLLDYWRNKVASKRMFLTR